MMYKFPFRIKIVQNSISIVRVACCEYNDLKVFGEILKDLFGVRSDVEPDFSELVRRLFYHQFNLVWRGFRFGAVYQGLIEVKNNCFAG